MKSSASGIYGELTVQMLAQLAGAEAWAGLLSAPEPVSAASLLPA